MKRGERCEACAERGEKRNPNNFLNQIMYLSKSITHTFDNVLYKKMFSLD